jgi:hypothetical protein
METDEVENRKNNRKLQNVLKKQRLEREFKSKMDALFQYYAKTDVSVERVADNMGVAVDVARNGLMNFGRTV